MAKHLLIVDDEAPFRFSASIALRQAGYEVSEAKDGEEGFMMIIDRHRRGIPFDMIVLDIHMPKMSGIDVYDALKQRGIEVPVMFISGYFDKATIKILEQKRYCGVLQKPFEAVQMLRSIEFMMS